MSTATIRGSARTPLSDIRRRMTNQDNVVADSRGNRSHMLPKNQNHIPFSSSFAKSENSITTTSSTLRRMTPQGKRGRGISGGPRRVPTPTRFRPGIGPGPQIVSKDTAARGGGVLKKANAHEVTRNTTKRKIKRKAALPSAATSSPLTMSSSTKESEIGNVVVSFPPSPRNAPAVTDDIGPGRYRRKDRDPSPSASVSTQTVGSSRTIKEENLRRGRANRRQNSETNEKTASISTRSSSIRRKQSEADPSSSILPLVPSTKDKKGPRDNVDEPRIMAEAEMSSADGESTCESSSSTAKRYQTSIWLPQKLHNPPLQSEAQASDSSTEKLVQPPPIPPSNQEDTTTKAPSSAETAPPETPSASPKIASKREVDNAVRIACCKSKSAAYKAGIDLNTAEERLEALSKEMDEIRAFRHAEAVVTMTDNIVDSRKELAEMLKIAEGKFNSYQEEIKGLKQANAKLVAEKSQLLGTVEMYEMAANGDEEKKTDQEGDLDTDLLVEAREELNKTKDELGRSTEKVQRLECQLQNAEERHKEEIAAVQKSWEEAEDRLRVAEVSAYEKEESIGELSQSLASTNIDLAASKASTQQVVSSLKEELECGRDQIKSLQSQLEESEAKLVVKVDPALSETSAEKSALISKLEAEITEMRRSSDEERNRWNEELQFLKKDIEVLNSRHKEETESLRTAHSAELEKLREDRQSRENNIVTSDEAGQNAHVNHEGAESSKMEGNADTLKNELEPSVSALKEKDDIVASLQLSLEKTKIQHADVEKKLDEEIHLGLKQREKFDEEKASLRAEVSSLQASVEMGDMLVRDMETNHGKEVETYQHTIQNLKQNLEARNNTIHNLQESLAKGKTRDTERIDEMAQSMHDARSNLEAALATEKEHLSTMNELRRSIEEKEIEIATVDSMYKETVKELEHEVDMLRSKIESLESQLSLKEESFRDLCKSSNEQSQRRGQMIGTLKTEVSELRQSLLESQTKEEKLKKGYEQELSSLKISNDEVIAHLRDEHGKEVVQLRETSASNERTVFELRKSLELANHKVERCEQMSTALEELENELEKVSVSLSDQKALTNNLQKTNANLSNTVAELDNEKLELRNEVEREKERARSFESKLACRDETVRDLRKLTQDHVQRKENMIALKEENLQLRQLLDELQTKEQEREVLHEQNLSGLREINEDALRNLQDKHQKEIAKLKDTADKSTKRAGELQMSLEVATRKVANSQDLSNTVDHLRGELENVSSSLLKQQAIASNVQKINATLSAANAKLQDEKSRLENDVEREKEKALSLESQLASKEDIINNIFKSSSDDLQQKEKTIIAMEMDITELRRDMDDAHEKKEAEIKAKEDEIVGLKKKHSTEVSQMLHEHQELVAELRKSAASRDNKVLELEKSLEGAYSKAAKADMLTATVDKLRGEFEEASASFSNQKALIEELQNSNENLSRRANELELEKLELTAAVKTFQTEKLEMQREKDSLESSVEKADASMQRVREECERRTAQLESLNAKLCADLQGLVEKTKAEKETAVSEIKKSLDYAHAKLERVLTEQEDNFAQIRELKESRDDLHHKLSTEKYKVTKMEQVIEKGRKQLGVLESSRDEAMSHLRQSKDESQEKSSRIAKLESHIKEISQSLEEYRKGNHLHEKEISGLKEKFDKDVSLLHYENKKDIADLERAAEEKNRTIVDLQVSLRESEEQIEGVNRAVEQVNGELHTAVAALKQKTAELNSLQDSLAESERRLNARIKQQSEIVEKLESENHTLRGETSSLQASIEMYDMSLRDAEEKNNRVEMKAMAKLKEMQAKIEVVTKRSEELESELSEVNANIEPVEKYYVKNDEDNVRSVCDRVNADMSKTRIELDALTKYICHRHKIIENQEA